MISVVMDRKDPEVLLPELHFPGRSPQVFVALILHVEEESRENSRITLCAGCSDMAQDHLCTDVDAFVIEPCVALAEASEGWVRQGDCARAIFHYGDGDWYRGRVGDMRRAGWQ